MYLFRPKLPDSIRLLTDMFRPISWGSMHHNIAVKLLSITSSTIFVIAILACSSTKEVVVQVDKIVEVPVEKIVKVEVDKQVVVEKLL